MQATQAISISWAITFVFGISILYFIAWGINDWKPKRITCSDFTSYESALLAFNKGALWLDRNNDKTPCNSLFASR